MTPLAVSSATRCEVTIHVGDVHASARPTLVKTLPGSCIAVCLWDPARRVGGMNHFMLPRALACSSDDSARFGVHAMDLLIGAIMEVGGDRRRFRAKVFGGGHVLDLADSQASVPRSNILFTREFLHAEGFPVAAEDLGGRSARLVHFETESGRAFVKRLGGVRPALVARERRIVTPAPAPPAYGEVTRS